MTTAGTKQRPVRESEPLHPRHDPAFADRLITDLVWHPGEWRDLGTLYASHVDSTERFAVVAEAVRGARRVGLQIEGERGRGYRLTGFCGYRWVHLHKALAWPAEETAEEPALDGQRSLLDLLE